MSVRTFAAYVCLGFGVVLLLSALPAFLGLAGLGATSADALARAMASFVFGFACVGVGVWLTP